MCGIVGAVSQRNVVPMLIEGLRRLEYRGYDSCGVAVHRAGMPRRARCTARVNSLARTISDIHLEGSLGIAHTRWATHGAPATENAHPIFSRDLIAIVHNGIIENHESLKSILMAQGYEFQTETDTEVIAHLVHSFYDGDLLSAVIRATRMFRGAYAIAAFSNDEPGRMVGARDGSPLVAGIGETEAFLASDAIALAGYTNRFVFLEDGDVVDLTPGNLITCDRNGRSVKRPDRMITQSLDGASLGSFSHYMQKEIFEQPLAIARTLGEIDALTPSIFQGADRSTFESVGKVLLLGCGTSHHAGLVAQQWFETIARVPVQVEIASEFRYRDQCHHPHTLVVPVSQSGETADTLAALKYAQMMGLDNTLAIGNVANSAMMRATRSTFLTGAGMEIGVASTKAFTTQLTALFLLAATLGRVRGTVSSQQESAYLQQLQDLPIACRAVLAQEPQIIAWASEISQHENAFYLGRGAHYPIAMEGALKLKEIAYIHAEAYAAGELKHGPLALVTPEMPTIVSAPNDALLDKLKSNMQEVRARGGQLFVIADSGTGLSCASGLRVLETGAYFGLLSPILHVLPMQLLAYHCASARQTDIDKPRNLAKSVTVE
ncbi:glutamine--fructose-6-phosphate transaminase (isomerizing) [Paraburkholderia diazotrophica]|uniref:glutamine--fructose-6-phosphate transaminase (isomerizing) n=1 Tax=Paraburkholderia diazotrophica TaxID=667676 RepID=UPI003173AF2C